MFLDRNNEGKLMPASFSYFLTTYERKQILAKKGVIVITVIIFVHYKETKLFCLLRSGQKVAEK